MNEEVKIEIYEVELAKIRAILQKSVSTTLATTRKNSSFDKELFTMNDESLYINRGE